MNEMIPMTERADQAHSRKKTHKERQAVVSDVPPDLMPPFDSLLRGHTLKKRTRSAIAGAI